MSTYSMKAEEFDAAVGNLIATESGGISGIDVVSILLKRAAWFVEAWVDPDESGLARLVGVLRDAEKQFVEEYACTECPI
jgi:hypothetical protein